jgi:RNA polymerase sigma-70 factor (ECF subfamily)
VNTETVQIATFPRLSAGGPGLRELDIEVRMRAEDSAEEARLFRDLLDPHQRRLYNFIQKSLPFPTWADDVYQETILRGLKYFKSYKRELSFRTWLFKIAHHEINKQRRRAGREIPLENPTWLASCKESVDRVLVQEIHRLARALKPVPRQVFFLFYDSDLTIAEISEVTGLKEGNIKYILSGVRESLRESLGE